MNFGQDFNCSICRKEIDGDYHRYTSDMLGMDMEFFACKGDCDLKFQDEYVGPFESVENRWSILDL